MANDSSFNEADIDESLWDSPIKQNKNDKPSIENTSTAQTGTRPSYVDQKAREESLRQELASVRKVNETIEDTIGSLQKAQNNMSTVHQTVSATSTLLNTWTRILSQTEHNQRIILDTNWQGTSQDFADIEEETIAKQQAAERREAEEQERKLAVARKAEEDERRKAEAITKTTRPSSRGRVRSSGRGTQSSQQGSGASSSSVGNSSISVGRGVPTTRRVTSSTSRGISSRGSRSRP